MEDSVRTAHHLHRNLAPIATRGSALTHESGGDGSEPLASRPAKPAKPSRLRFAACAAARSLRWHIRAVRRKAIVSCCGSSCCAEPSCQAPALRQRSFLRRTAGPVWPTRLSAPDAWKQAPGEIPSLP